MVLCLPSVFRESPPFPCPFPSPPYRNPVCLFIHILSLTRAAPCRRLSGKNIKLLRPTLYSYIETEAEFQGYARDLFNLMTPSTGPPPFKVHLYGIYPLDEVARAHRDLESRKTTGKLLVRV